MAGFVPATFLSDLKRIATLQFGDVVYATRSSAFNEPCPDADNDRIVANRLLRSSHLLISINQIVADTLECDLR